MKSKWNRQRIWDKSSADWRKTALSKAENKIKVALTQEIEVVASLWYGVIQLMEILNS